MVSTASAFNTTADILLNLGIISHHANSFLKYADRTHYNDSVNLRTTAMRKAASQMAMGAIDPLVYEARELLFNRVSGGHTDSQDPLYSWAILVALGYNSPVTFEVSPLNLRMSFAPGDAIAIRGRVLKHRTSGWKSGQRIVIPHFTHQATWDSYQVPGPRERCDTS